jgi:3-oxoacyl-[acyl-carrier protein] reductase
MNAGEAQVAIVTGASRGIGVALTRALLGAGYTVHAIARDHGRLTGEYRREIADGRVKPARLDVTDADAVDTFFARSFPAGARLDLLYNNAARFESLAPVWDADIEQWWADVTVNIRGPFLMSRAALKVMRRADRGVIVNMDGGRPPSGSAYATSKAGLLEFTRMLNAELRQAGSKIAVYSANPGLVETDMTRLQATNAVAREWLPGVGERLARGDTRRPEEIAAKLVAQLPHMSAATSGGFFDPDTPTGSFRALAIP